MSAIEIGKPFVNATWSYVQYVPETGDEVTACGIPGPFNTEKEFKGKTVVLVGVPGAFTPTCQANHLPDFVKLISQFKAKADLVIILSSNDPFVLSAWGKANGIKDEILMCSDGNAAWSQQTGYDIDLTSKGLGVRTTRFGMVIKDGEVIYAEKESNPGGQPSVSSAQALLSKL